MAPLCIPATLLNPRSKDVWFETESEKKYVKNLLCAEAEKGLLEMLGPPDKAVTHTVIILD